MKVVFTRTARAQAMRMGAWWRENRPDSPELFERELSEAIRWVAVNAERRPVHTHRGDVPVRRVRLRKTRNYLYYELDKQADAVVILATWGGLKGREPTLTRD